jgi:hypothetical protein
MMERGTLYRTFEYVDHAQNNECVEVRIHFTYSPGCEAQTSGPAERCHPAEAAEWEYDSAQREGPPGSWKGLHPGEWLEEWCRDTLENTEECDITAALPDPEDVEP